MQDINPLKKLAEGHRLSRDSGTHAINTFVYAGAGLLMFCSTAIVPRLEFKVALNVGALAAFVLAARSHEQHHFASVMSGAVKQAGQEGFLHELAAATTPPSAARMRAQEAKAQPAIEPESPLPTDPWFLQLPADKTAQNILLTLNSAQLRAEFVEAVAGLAFTRYLILPDPGVSVDSVLKKSRDLQVQCFFSSEPLMSVVQGAVAIDVPSPTRQFVGFAEAVRMEPLPVPTMAIGVDHLTYETVEVEFSSSSMENYVIGGLPRQGGKTSLIYLMMASLARCPQMIRFVIFDGKGGVSFNFMQGHPLLMRSPELDFEIAVNRSQGFQLISQIKEHIDRRYELFRKTGVSHLDAYNARSDTPLPYIFVIVDECQGVLEAKGESLKKWEETLSICNAAGVGFAFATQRVDANVIPEQINSKCASRVCLLVQSDKDSNYVLNGLPFGSKLLGKGDLMFRPGGSSPVRLQSPYLSMEDAEILFEVLR